jgi:hypothetical protein
VATFLITPRMNPALAERVERAVSHRRRARHHAVALGLRQAFPSGRKFGVKRTWPLLVAAAVAVFAVAVFVKDRRALEAERGALLGALAERRAALPAGHEGFLANADRWITHAASATEPEDLVEPALRQRGALDGWLRRPAVYMHGLAADLRDPHRLDEAARASDKDAFLVCLTSPPPSSSERDLLGKVRGVYFEGAKVDEQTANVRRLAEARRGLAMLGPAFEASVRMAVDHGNLRVLRKDLEAAPIDQARKAAGAELLVVVADGPGREARVALVDLTSQKVLLRLRRPLEEQGNSPMASLHRGDLEACALALAVRRAVEP